MFQFPSNGKVHLDGERRMDHVMISLVSIPFKREGASGLSGCAFVRRRAT